MIRHIKYHGGETIFSFICRHPHLVVLIQDNHSSSMILPLSPISVVPTEDEDLVAKGDAVVGDSARGALTAEEEEEEEEEEEGFDPGSAT